jgi:hypothetical protein
VLAIQDGVKVCLEPRAVEVAEPFALNPILEARQELNCKLAMASPVSKTFAM